MNRIITTPFAYMLLALGLIFLNINVSGAPLIQQQKVNSIGESPEVCFKLDEPLSAKEQHYSDYFRLVGRQPSSRDAWEPQRVSVRTTSDLVCVTSLRHGYEYRATMLAGLPFSKSPPLSSDQTFSFKTPDLSQSIAFQNNSFVLPTHQGPSVPIVVTNVTDFVLKVYRLSNEDVIYRFKNDSFGNPLDGYDLNGLFDSATHFIGEQTIKIDLAKNKRSIYNLDLSKVLDKQEPGAYVLAIEPTLEDSLSNWRDRPTQYLMYTDIGLTSYLASDGLHVYARSYSTGEPLSGVSTEVVAKNNDILGTAVSDQSGKVFFKQPIISGQKGHQPVAVRAKSSNGQFSVLNIVGQKVDLSDRGIGGSSPLSMLNAYLWTERGVYRPGENVVVSGITRTKDLIAPQNLPLTLKIFRPDGQEDISTVITEQVTTGLQHRFDVPSNARTGQWNAKLYFDPKEAPIGSVSFLVEDYVPQTLKATLMLLPDGYAEVPVQAELQGDFLYGAPAAQLDVENSVILTNERRLFKEYPQYVFGTIGDLIRKTWSLEDMLTDASGLAQFQLPKNLLDGFDKQRAMKLTVRSGISEPSRRITVAQADIPVLNFNSFVGIKTDAERPTYEYDQDPVLKVLNVSKNGNALSGNELSYRVIKERWDYHWYYSNGWQYTVNNFDLAVVNSGSLVTDSMGAGYIKVEDLSWGHYRIEVSDVNSGQITSLRFRMGWWNAQDSASASPDHVRVGLSKPSAAVGEKITLNIVPPYAGRLHLIVANGEILEEIDADIGKEGLNIAIRPQPEWGAGVYILSTVYRPGTDNPGPARAVGVSYVKIDKPEMVSQLQIFSPQKIKPNSLLTVKVRTDLEPGGRVILAAVDEGILQLTNYVSPNPSEWFLTKRRLDLAIFDLYGHLIQHQDGERLTINFGSDADPLNSQSGSLAMNDGLKDPLKPVALVSEIQSIDRNGEATFNFNVPQFNGNLRLMAVGFSNTKFGESEGKVIVRDPITVQPSIPRFLSIGDKTEVGATLHNLELPQSLLKYEWSASPHFEIMDDAQSVSIGREERISIGSLVTAKSMGDGFIRLKVTRPDGTVQEYSWNLKVANNRLIERHTQSLYLDMNELGVLKNQLDGTIESTKSISMRLTDKPIVSTDWLTKSLSLYMFGCLEQTASKAFPLIYLPADRLGLSNAEKDRKVSNAISHIGQMQLPNGSFGLWVGSTKPESWLTMYAVDFLLESKLRGYLVQNHVIDNATQFLKQYMKSSQNDWRENISGVAYAMYIATKQNFVDLGELRYFHSLITNTKVSNSTLIMTASAFDLLGDFKRRDELLLRLNEEKVYSWSRDDYRSSTRDSAMVAFYILSNPNTSFELKKATIESVGNLFDDARKTQYLSTQEMAWLVRLGAILDDAKQLPKETPVRLDFKKTAASEIPATLLDQKEWLTVKNLSNQPINISLESSGISKDLSDALFAGLSIFKEYIDPATGKTIDMNNVKVTQEILVKVKIKVNDSADRELSLVDHIPAGFEIENPRLSGGRKTFTDLELSTPNFEEFRDDGYFAVWSLPSGKDSSVAKYGQINAAYIMRAISTGSYLHPAARVEDMYQPAIRGNTAERFIEISE